MRSLVLGVAALALVGCTQKDAQYCNRNPGDPDCIPEAGVVGGLTYRSREIVDGGVVQLGVCGQYTRSINWLMPDGAPTDGYIVQRIDAVTDPACASDDDFELQTCAAMTPPGCEGEDAPGYIYWETWPISAGDTVSAGEDIWAISSHAVPVGRATITGEARYYRDEQMGDEHPDDPMSPFALHPVAFFEHRWPSTTVEPDFWQSDERPALVRSVTVEWMCCPPERTEVIEDTHDR